MQETKVWSLGWADPLEKEMATHASILAWRIPWTQEPGGLQSMRLQRVRHDLGTKQQQQWGRRWPVPKRDMRDILSGDLGLNTGWTECYLSSHRTITNYVQKSTQLLNNNKHSLSSVRSKYSKPSQEYHKASGYRNRWITKSKNRVKIKSQETQDNQGFV